jgi:copper oxidase (laccase) domain-containing protein
VDLALSARLALVQAGLTGAAVDHVAGCTFDDPARFYSFRRDGGRTGRHLAAIVPRC